MSILLLSGCTEVEKKDNSKNKFIGKWTTKDSIIEQFIFYENDLCKIKTYELIATYNVSEEEKILTINQIDPPLTYEYKYSFSNNNEKLILIESKTGASWRFFKEE